MHILYALVHLILWYLMKYLFCFLFINAECHLLPEEGDKSKTDGDKSFQGPGDLHVTDQCVT